MSRHVFKYAFGTRETKFRVMAGPQFGILLDATQNYTRNGSKIGTTAVDLDGNVFVTDANNITISTDKIHAFRHLALRHKSFITIRFDSLI